MSSGLLRNTDSSSLQCCGVGQAQIRARMSLHDSGELPLPTRGRCVAYGLYSLIRCSRVVGEENRSAQWKLTHARHASASQDAAAAKPCDTGARNTGARHIPGCIGRSASGKIMV